MPPAAKKEKDRDAALREQLRRLLAWEDAHVGFQHAVKGLTPVLRARVPDGLPYSAWQLLEHLRRAQHDMLDFCRNPDYRELKFPDDYWPVDPAPPSANAWDASVRNCVDDRSALAALAGDPHVDLFARIPHGSGQTYLRELLLAADHAAYHVGEIVTVRRLLGAWPPP
jgi:DinB family protein